MGKTAFVTGGSGFIGINLIELLVAEGWRVLALHRPTSSLTYLRRFPVELVEGSLTDRASLAAALPRGVDVVFHVAGDTNFWSKRNARQWATNVDGTKNMVEAAAAKRVGAFIHTSSNSAWGRVKGVVTEETPRRGASSWINYERTKHLGELEALRGRALGMKVVVLNPGDVVGPYDATTWGRLFFMLRDGALPALPPGVVSITHVHDVVRAHLAAVDKGEDGEQYLLAGEDHEMAELVSQCARLLGVKTPRKAPAWALKLYARLAVAMASVTDREPEVTPEIAAIGCQKGVSFRSDKAIRELGYRIRPMSAGVEDCFAWLKQEGLL